MNTNKILLKGLYILTEVFIAIIQKFLFPILSSHTRSERQIKSVEIRENVEDEPTSNASDRILERLKRIIKTDKIITVEESERQMRVVKSTYPTAFRKCPDLALTEPTPIFLVLYLYYT